MRPVDVTSTERRRLFFFGILYFAQGVPWGFISVTLALYLTAEGMGEEALGRVLALSYLPWGFKPLFGPLADGLNLGWLGRRRPWIVAAELGMGVTLLALAGVDPKTAMPLFLGLLFAHNLFAAAQDVGVDALAVEILEEKERGAANSVMWAAKYAGVAVGGAGFSAIGKALGWRWLFLFMAVLILVIALLPAMVRESPRRIPVPPSGRGRKLGGVDHVIHGIALLALPAAFFVFSRYGWVLALWYVVAIGLFTAIARTCVPDATPIRNQVITETIRSFGLRSTFIGLGLVLVAQAGSGLSAPMMVPFMKNQLGYSDAEIGMVSGLFSSVIHIFGALAGGFISDRIGRRKAIALFTLATAASYAVFAVLGSFWHDRAFVYGFILCSSLAEGMLTSTYLSLCMDLSNPAVGGTQFTTYMAFSNLKSSWTSWAGGIAAARLPPAIMFLIAAGAQAASLLLLPFVNLEEAKKAFRKGEEPPGGDKEVALDPAGQ
jgi:PAT family beta-lactamase induction signal transducer AmpG